MQNNQNKLTQEDLKREVKDVQQQCINICKVIDNTPRESPAITSEDVRKNIINYVNGLHTEVQNSNTPITTNEDILTSQFLIEVTEKTKQIDELTAFTNGAIQDLDSEINRIKNQIKIADEAKSKSNTGSQTVRPEHIQKARDQFHQMKKELHGLLHSLFPNEYHEIIELMGYLMAAKLNESSIEYLSITTENYHLIKLLKDMKIVSSNPYNYMEVKLAY